VLTTRGIRMRRWFAIAIVLSLSVGPHAQGLSQNDAYLIREMLRNAYETVKAHYYDPTYHGLDWDARYREFPEKLKSATSVDAGEVVVAQFLEGLKDSHTFFQPPARSFTVDYGYQVDLLGNDAFVTHVHAGTDAATRLKPGDRVISVNGLPIDRDSYHTVQYILTILAPRTSTELVVDSPGGDKRTVMVLSAVHQKRIARSLTNGNEISAVNQERQAALRSLRQQYVEMGAVMIWKMPAFFVEDGEIDRLFGVARKHAGLVLDLRGNPGGTRGSEEDGGANAWAECVPRQGRGVDRQPVRLSGRNARARRAARAPWRGRGRSIGRRRNGSPGLHLPVGQRPAAALRVLGDRCRRDHDRRPQPRANGCHAG